jgi:hypothetical protein
MCLACRPGLLAFAKHGTARRGFLKGMMAAGALFAAKASAAEPAASAASPYADLIMRARSSMLLFMFPFYMWSRC